MKPRHPFLRRVGWNPAIVAMPFAYLAYTTYLAGFPVPRTIGAAFVGLWFGLSVFDFATRHRLLDWLYSDEESTSESANSEGDDGSS
jgi:hypothetical protein